MNSLAEPLSRGEGRAPTTGLALDAVQLAVVVGSLAWAAIAPLVWEDADVTNLFMLALPFVLVHGLRTYSPRTFMVFLATIYLISNAYENLSIVTGFPFGHYHYTGGPQLFHVPVSIGLFYIVIGYLSWATATTLLGGEARLAGARLVVLPALAAAVMTMFDLTADPAASTIGHVWVWEKGGGFYGVPLSNFLGWWLTTYSFFQVFALFQRATGKAPRSGGAIQPVLLYLSLGLISVPRLIAYSGHATATDASGRTWAYRDIYAGSVIVFVFTMAVVAGLAIYAAVTRPANGEE